MSFLWTTSSPAQPAFADTGPFHGCRFEKYAVSVNSFWELLRARKDAASQHVLDDVLAKCQDLVSTVGSPAFHGAVPDSTVATALLSVLQDSLPQDDQLLANVDQQHLVQELVRAVASRLLQIMKPHVFLLQAYAGVRLPLAYEDFYLHKQEHYNLKQLLSAILRADPLPSLASQADESATSCFQVEAGTDVPETSAAGEARAALGCQGPVLRQAPPRSKWVIFTSTTPELQSYVMEGSQVRCPSSVILLPASLLHALLVAPASLLHLLQHSCTLSRLTADLQSSRSAELHLMRLC